MVFFLFYYITCILLNIEMMLLKFVPDSY